MIRLIENTFDDVVILHTPSPSGEELDFPTRLYRLVARDRLYNLWEQESHYQREMFPRQFPANLAQLAERAREPVIPRPKEAVFELLRDRVPGRVVQNATVASIKPNIGRLRRPYSFKFDFMVDVRHPALIDVIRGAHYGMRRRLRYLSLKARLIRYRIEDGVLAPNRAYQPLLIVDGNIAGPDHDPFRYIRALIRVGWIVAGQEQQERIMETILR
jgi:hypothetical protein